MTDSSHAFGDGDPELVDLIRKCIVRRTNGAIRDLDVSLAAGSIVISGRTSRFYVKQLATSAVLDELPIGFLELHNGIEVNHENGPLPVA